MGFFYMSDEAWKALSKAEKDDLIRRETDSILHQFDMIEAGLAVRRAGLVWFLPLCHDAYGAGL